MPHAATMNDELFRALRDDAGMPEAVAAKVARLIFQQGESAVRAERKAEREVEREVFAEKGDVAVLQSEMTDVKAAIVRIDATLVEIKENAARTDEKVNNLQWLTKVVVIPLSLLNLTALFGVIGLLIRLLMVSTAP